jgi:FMN-dependent NADH-azoreductase
MSTLLHVKASPRGDRSYSAAAASAFLEAYRSAHADDTVDTLDVFAESLPAFDGPALDAKYAILHGGKPSPEGRAAWGEVERTIERFASADKYLFSLPMWNFGIPYRLKHLFDVIVQPSYTFSFSPEKGYTGLVTGKPAVAVYARGGAYPPGSDGEAFDLQKKYLELILGFIGFTDIHSVVVEPTLSGDGAALREAAAAEAKKLAASF